MAGGLKFAAEMSWRSPTRLCILIADAPCHGRKFHDSYEDNYPLGDPNGLDPIELLYILQVSSVSTFKARPSSRNEGFTSRKPSRVFSYTFDGQERPR